MILARPPSYISAPEFRNMPSDYDLSTYDDPALELILRSASGEADAIIKRSLLAQERTERFYGSGNNTIALHNRPILYVRQMSFIVPGFFGATIPIDRISIDAIRGSISIVRPLLYADVGYHDFFRRDVPIDITYAWGYGRNTFTAPQWTSVDTYAGLYGLVAGSYVIGVTTRTQWGETMANTATVTTVSGAIAVTAQPTIGAYSYRVYAMPSSGSGPVDPSLLNLVAEIPSSTFTGGPMSTIITSLNPPAFQFTQTAPTYDSSAPPMPDELREAVRLLALGRIYEQNNLSNRGVARTESGRKSIQWRSTEGSSGRGVPLFYDQAAEMLSGFVPEVY